MYHNTIQSINLTLSDTRQRLNKLTKKEQNYKTILCKITVAEYAPCLTL